MEWTRVELKTNAKRWLGRCYWKAFLVCLIVSILTGIGNSARGNSNNNSNSTASDYTNIESYNDLRDTAESITSKFGFIDYGPSMNIFRDGLTFSNLIRVPLTIGTAIIILVVSLATILLSIFIFDILTVGRSRFLLSSRVSDTQIEELLFPFKNGYYIQTVFTIFLKNLFTTLWSLLFIIPGIIKAYEYRMIPYLLAEYPNMTREDAFRYTKDMMYGEKWNTFVLDLSFLGWQLLGTLACGIGIYFVNPYIEATNVELYLALKHKVNL